MTEEMKELSFLLGTWQTEGEVHATANSEAIRFNGTDTYESVLNGSYILHKVDVMMGEERVEVIELIGNNKEKPGSYLLHSFDSTGSSQTMQAEIEERNVLKIYNDEMRAALTQPGQDELKGAWEKLEEEKWVKWMEVTLRRT